METNELRTCDVCGKPFSQKEWEDRHTGHELGCSYTTLGWCCCDRVYHAGCCTDCQAKELVWVAFAEWYNGNKFFVTRTYDRLLNKVASWIINDCQLEKQGIILDAQANPEQIIETYYAAIEDGWLTIELVELD